MLLVQSTRTFTVWVAALLVAGVIGAAVIAELGSPKMREEIEAMKVTGIDPVWALAVPRDRLDHHRDTTVFSSQISATYIGDSAPPTS